jgi:hypothetical protein
MMTIVSDLDDDVFTTVDQGRPRTTGDILSVAVHSDKPVGDWNNRAASANWLLHMEEKRICSGDVIGSKATKSKVIDCYHRNEPLLSEGLRLASRHGLSKIMPRAVGAAIFAHFSRDSHARTYAFFTDLTEVQPASIHAALLKEKLNDNRAARSKMNREELAALCMKAVRKYLDDQKIKQLNYRTGEPVSYAN